MRPSLLAVCLLALLALIPLHTVGAKKPEGHLLVLSHDAALIGASQTTISERIRSNTEANMHGILTGWEEVRYASFAVFQDDQPILVDSTSYKYSSPTASDEALVGIMRNEVPDWMRLSHSINPLSPVIRNELQSLGLPWHTWSGRDTEDLPTYVFWQRDGSYIREIHMTMLPGMEEFGKEVINHLVKVLISNSEKIMPPLDDETGAGNPDAYVSSRAYDIEPTEDWHYLAVWARPHGHSPHFHGSGGDATTCPSEHGCISNWSWWLHYPQSKLGIAKSFYLPNFHNGSNKPSNYSASVWID